MAGSVAVTRGPSTEQDWLGLHWRVAVIGCRCTPRGLSGRCPSVLPDLSGMLSPIYLAKMTNEDWLAKHA
jgi:hypothetical protein